MGLGRHKFSTSTLYSDFIREIYLGGDASSEIVPRIDGIECEFERKREEERRRGRGGRRRISSKRDEGGGMLGAEEESILTLNKLLKVGTGF